MPIEKTIFTNSCFPGPYAHLFHNVHEQHYLYHAVSFAAKYGEYETYPVENSASKMGNMLASLIGF